METDINKIEPQNQSEKNKGFWHGGWAYFLFLTGLIGLMVAISYIVKLFL